MDRAISNEILAPRDGNCPGCGEVICYLLPDDIVWEHSQPKAVYSGLGSLIDSSGKRFDVVYPVCPGSGNKALEAYFPLNYDPAWQNRPLSSYRKILKPEVAKSLRMTKLGYISG